MRHSVISLSIRSDVDVALARQRASHVAELLGCDPLTRTKIATSVSEVARNAFRYAGSGTAEFFLVDAEVPTLEVVITDHGPGIADLDRVLAGSYASETGMGIGLAGSRRLMDEFDISTSPEGTTVKMGMQLGQSRTHFIDSEIRTIRRELSSSAALSAAEELHRQNLELIAALDELNERHEELLRLDRELADTNRGVVALYAELDERAERLREADKVKSRFLSFVSHEFRTPLSSILALARLLLDRTDGDLGEEQEKQVQFIRQSARELADLVEDLLDLSRVEAGKTEVRIDSFSLNSVFSALRGVMRPLLKDSDVELIIGIPDQEIMVRSDQAKLAQILRNLVSNAVKFTEHGHVQVTATLSDDGSSVVISVEDTGIGIDPAHFDLIFEEYGQVKTGIKPRFKGTGLGLPLSRRLAEILGGTLTVRSEPGQGSCFTLQVPITFDQRRVRRHEREAEAAESRVQDVMPALCLVVDDEESSRYLMRRLIEDEGCDVIEAGSGSEAMAIVRSESPDVVFVDLLMPDMLGLDVAERIINDESLAAITVVLVTSKILSDTEHEQLVRLRVPIVPKQSLTSGVVRAVLSNLKSIDRSPSIIERAGRR